MYQVSQLVFYKFGTKLNYLPLDLTGLKHNMKENTIKLQKVKKNTLFQNIYK